MAARDEQQQQDRAVLDSAAPGGSQTGRAVSLARLLHRESSLLLQLWVCCLVPSPVPHCCSNERCRILVASIMTFLTLKGVLTFRLFCPAYERDAKKETVEKEKNKQPLPPRTHLSNCGLLNL